MPQLHVTLHLHHPLHLPHLQLAVDLLNGKVLFIMHYNSSNIYYYFYSWVFHLCISYTYRRWIL